MKITKEWLEENRACKSGFKWFLSQKESDAAMIMLKLVEECRGGDAFWVMQRTIKYKNQAVKIAIFAAEQAIDIYEQKYPESKCPRKAIEAAKAYLKNPSDKTKLAAADAYAAATAAFATNAVVAAAAYAAASAAYAAASAAYIASTVAADTYAVAACACAAYTCAGAARKDLQTKIIKHAIETLGL